VDEHSLPVPSIRDLSEVRSIPKLTDVDPAGIVTRIFTLPREISYAAGSTKEKSSEVNSSYEERTIRISGEEA
jgi:hypothetical protein